MTVNADAIRHRRDQALKDGKLPMLARKLLLDDFEALLKEIEGVRRNGAENNPSGGEWEIEEYSVWRPLKSGERKEYRYKREVRYEHGRKIVRHISVRNGTK